MVKEQEIVRIEDDWNKRRFFTGKRFLVLIFVLIAVLLLVYAFYGGFPNITGGVIDGFGNDNESNVSSIFDIRAELGELNSYLDIDNDIEKISIELKENDANVYFGKDGALNLSDLGKVKIEIEGFRGNIVFDKDKIYNLNGNVFKLRVDDILTSSLNSEMKISISKELDYESIELNSVYLKKYNSVSTKGKVIIDNDRVNLNLNEESFFLQEFRGKIQSGLVGNFGIKKQGFILDGTASGVNVGGKFKIDVNS